MKEYILTFAENGTGNGEFAYIGGKSLLPSDIMWPKNPKGENLVLIMTIPTNFLNKYLNNQFTRDKIISVFTTYDKKNYFLDTIVYHGDDEGLNNIKEGFTRVIFHDIDDTARNECECEIPKRLFELEMIEDEGECGGSKLGGRPCLLQNKTLKLDDYEFVLQIYGGDFPGNYDDIFYLSDSMGYLYLSNKGDGVFFTQCT